MSSLIRANREDALIAFFEFIEIANTNELAKIIEEIRCCHDNLVTYNNETSDQYDITKISVDEYANKIVLDVK